MLASQDVQAGLALLWSLCGLSPSIDVCADVTLGDFANAARLHLDGDGAAYRLSLPERVYADVTRDDLGDLRVFNAAGAVVPHEARLPPANAERLENVVDLAFFPLGDEVRDLDHLRLFLARGNKLTLLGLETGNGSRSRIVGYVIDARAARHPIHRLWLEWTRPDGAAGFLTHVGVEASDDLCHWRVLVADAEIADLRHLGQQLRRERIDLPAGAHAFYRLTLKQPGRTPAITRMRAWGSEHVLPPPTRAAGPFDRIGDSAMLDARLDANTTHPGDGRAPAEPLDWRRYTLRGVLILGAIVVIMLAPRPLRGMDEERRNG